MVQFRTFDILAEQAAWRAPHCYLRSCHKLLKAPQRQTIHCSLFTIYSEAY